MITIHHRYSVEESYWLPSLGSDTTVQASQLWINDNVDDIQYTRDTRYKRPTKAACA